MSHSMNKLACLLLLLLSTLVIAHPYERNKAVPVDKVLFGSINSVRNITEKDIRYDHANGWHRFGGALIGGAIGNQFGDGSGQVAATILGAMIGSNVTRPQSRAQKIVYEQLVELLITTEQEGQFMVIQDYDKQMIFKAGDTVRLVYLATGHVRVDIAY